LLFYLLFFISFGEKEEDLKFNPRLAKELVEKYDGIVYEKLAIKNMVKNRFLAKSINDAG